MINKTDAIKELEKFREDLVARRLEENDPCLASFIAGQLQALDVSLCVVKNIRVKKSKPRSASYCSNCETHTTRSTGCCDTCGGK